MAIQYRPTKQKEKKAVKPNRMPKAPRPEKAIRLEIGAAVKKINIKRYIMAAVIITGVLVVAVWVAVVVGRVQAHGKQVACILVSMSPKLEYRVGDKLRTEGLQLQVILNNGETYFVSDGECEFSGFDSSKAAERQTITVSYKGVSCTYKIQIVDAPAAVRVVESIYLERLPQTEYKVGQWLSVTGGVLLVEYADGTYMRHNLTYEDVFGFVTDPFAETYVTQHPGTYELEIRYGNDIAPKTCTYTITVTE